MIINRVWAMANKWTFKIKPIKKLLDRYVGNGIGWIDPFAGMNSPAEITNDLNPDIPAKYHLDAHEFIKVLNGQNLQGCLWDPPYSMEQVSRSYKDVGIEHWQDIENNKSGLFPKVKNKIANTIETGGYVICCGWSSTGFGKKRGFKIIEILLVNHGRGHYDTIVTVERKVQGSLI